TALALGEFANTGEIAALRSRVPTGANERQAGEAVMDDQFLDAGLSPDALTPEGSLTSKTLPAEAPPEALGVAGNVLTYASADKPSSDARSELQGQAPLAESSLADSSEVVSRQPSEGIAPRTALEFEAESERISRTDLEGMAADDLELELVTETAEGDLRTPVDSDPQVEHAEPRASPTLRVPTVPSDSESLMPARASLALQRRDPVTLDQLARQLRSETHTVLADR